MTDLAPTNVTPISADSKLSDQEKRDQLRGRIQAGEQRLEERNFADQARDAADTAVAFVKKHPVATVAGAVTIGLAIGAILISESRKVARGGRDHSWLGLAGLTLIIVAALVVKYSLAGA